MSYGSARLERRRSLEYDATSTGTVTYASEGPVVYVFRN